MLRTKIVCTIGPASESPEMVRSLVEHGMDVARLNLSHGEHARHRGVIASVRAAADGAGRPVAILADLQGPRIRVGDLPAPIELRDGATVTLAWEGEAVPGEIPTTYRELVDDLEPGDRVLVDDGLLELECVEETGRRAILRVVRGGTLRGGKGINIPGRDLSAPSLTEKDLEDLEFLLAEGVEYVGLSFVRQGSDVEDLRRRIGDRALIVAKIELARALDRLDEILARTDLVMVARGDLGVELPFEMVPLAQKTIIQKANLCARPVITATQMLESMISHPRPTRAEASDVANAVLDGTDCVMLSGETAVGRHPVLAMQALRRVAGEIERSGVLRRGPRYLRNPRDEARGGAGPREHAIAAAAVDAGRSLGAPAIVVLTKSGFSARLVSSHRPSTPIFAVTTEPVTYRRLAAVWGVRPLLAPDPDPSYESLRDFAGRAVVAAGMGSPGDCVVVTAGFPFHEAGTTNTLRVETL